jgi:transcriptional regulator with XRE-family HTH domain
MLHEFITWLQKRSVEPGSQRALSQSDIARRSGLSQSMINKVMQRRGTASSPATYQRLCAAFWHQWVQFLQEHEELRAQLARDYQWVAPALKAGVERPDSDMAEGTRLLGAIFASDTHKGLVLQQLRAQAAFIGARPSSRSKPRQADSGVRRHRG